MIKIIPLTRSVIIVLYRDTITQEVMTIADIYICSWCGKLTYCHANYCTTCGNKLVRQIDLSTRDKTVVKTCACGFILILGVDYCPNCGAAAKPTPCIHRMLGDTSVSTSPTEPL